MTLGKRIEEAYLRLGLNQSSAAVRLGISQPRLNNFIKDRRMPKADVLHHIAVTFDTTIEELLGFTETEVDVLEGILSRLLELEGIKQDRAGTLAKIAVSAQRIALASASPDVEPIQNARVAAHAAWLSRSNQTTDK